MKFVPEHLNEIDFERGKDPREAMGLGKKAQIKKDLEKVGIDPLEVEITDDLIIKNKSVYDSQSDELFYIQMKYLSEEKKKFVQELRHDKITVNVAIDDALDDGISADEVKELIEEFGKYKDGHYTKNKISKGLIALTKITRSEEKLEEDEENNTYAFIGFMDKAPVEVNGKQYFEEKFVVETMIKIDKYDTGSLANITGMKLRARYSGHNADVYFVTIPKDMMDEERYDEIPPHMQNIVEKYKQKI